jgi:hypothetical protein
VKLVATRRRTVEVMTMIVMPQMFPLGLVVPWVIGEPRLLHEHLPRPVTLVRVKTATDWITMVVPSTMVMMLDVKTTSAPPVTCVNTIEAPVCIVNVVLVAKKPPVVLTVMVADIKTILFAAKTNFPPPVKV